MTSERSKRKKIAEVVSNIFEESGNLKQPQTITEPSPCFIVETKH